MTEKIKVPRGSPPWVTNKLIADTIRVWQPRYKKTITEEDALEILINVCQLSNNLDLTKTTQPSTSPVSAASRFDDHFEELIRKHLERPDLTPIQEGWLYEVMTMEIDPATGKKWTLRAIARHFSKSYGHVRNRRALVMPFKPDDVDEDGNIIKKGQGLTDEERSALERGEKTLVESVRRAYRCDTVGKADTARSPMSLRELQKIFDNTAEDNVERRKAIAECMGLTLKQATREAMKRRDAERKAQ